MNWKEVLRLTYGLFMGTSTPLLKKSKRPGWPLSIETVSQDLTLFIGGVGNGALLGRGEKALLLNTGDGASAKAIHQFLERVGALTPSLRIAISAASDQFAAGVREYSKSENVDVLTAGPTDVSWRAMWDRLHIRPESLTEELVLDVGGQVPIRLIPERRVHTGTDLVVFEPTSRTLFLGSLLAKGYHPAIDPGPDFDAVAWAGMIIELVERLKPAVIIPADGPRASPEDVLQFAEYLKALSDPAVEFQECRRRFDWPEIEGQTSLEENFDLLRGSRTHVRI